MLIEKAWAKVNGTYAHIIGGHTKHALKALTGAPATTYQHHLVDVNDLWDRIYHADQENFVMCCSVGSLDQEGGSAKGLADNHAYTLIGAYHVSGH